MHKIARGFTIVELIIVVTVIAILASITIVAYNGAQARAEYARAQTDMKHISDALTVYQSQNGSYPVGDGSTFQPVATALASLVPSYLDNANALTPKTGYAYLYRADTAGTDYELIRIYGTASSSCATLPSVETSGNPLMRTTGTCANKAWGYWSTGTTTPTAW